MHVHPQENHRKPRTLMLGLVLCVTGQPGGKHGPAEKEKIQVSADMLVRRIALDGLLTGAGCACCPLPSDTRKGAPRVLEDG
jgi:hypothetical protein